MRDNIWSLSFWVWITSLDVVFVNPIHFTANFIIWISVGVLLELQCVHVPQFHYLLGGHLVLSHSLATANWAA